MTKERFLATLLFLWIAIFQIGNIDATSLSNFNLETNWDTYLCANENPIVDEKTVILTATGLRSDNLPCVALRKNLKISGKYEMSSQLINVGPPTGERNFGLVFNAKDEKNYDFVYLSYDVHDKCIKVLPGYVEKEVITKSTTKLGCLDLQPASWNALKLIVKEECNHCNNVNVFVDGLHVGSFEAHFATRGFGGVLAENGFNNIAEFRLFDIAPIIPDLSDKPFCITIVTGGENSNDGTLTLTINNIVFHSSRNFRRGARVIHKCFSRFESIIVQNPTPDAWTGTITLLNGGMKRDLQCTSGCTGSNFNEKIVVDGNGDGTNQASTWCLNGKICTLKL